MSVGVIRDIDGIQAADEPLTFREKEFVGAFVLNGFNATAAIRTLGYGGKNPDVTAARYMKRPRVQKAVQTALSASRKAQEVTVERLKARYAQFAFAEHEGPVTPSHCLAALDKLGQHVGMFKSEQAVSVPVTFTFVGGPPLVVDDGTPPTVSAEPRAPAVGLFSVDKPTPR